MPALEYLSTNSLISYPFKDSRAVNSSLSIPDDAFLDALFITNEHDIKRVYISKISKISINISIELSEVNLGIIGNIVFPIAAAESHLFNQTTSFISYSSLKWSIKLVFGPGISFLVGDYSPTAYTADQTEFVSSVIQYYPRAVKSLTFNAYTPQGAISGQALTNVHTYFSGSTAYISNGANNEFSSGTNQTIYLDVLRGNGTGLWDPCSTGNIKDLYTVNEVSPNDAGSLFLNADDCYSLGLLSAAQLTDITGLSSDPNHIKTASDYSKFVTPINDGITYTIQHDVVPYPPRLVRANTITVRLTDPSLGPAIAANPGYYGIIFNGGYVAEKLTGATRVSGSVTDWIITGAWPIITTGFPITIKQKKTVFNAISSSAGGHGLIFKNNCSAKCAPENLSAFATYLNRITDGAAELYKIVNNPSQAYGSGNIVGSPFSLESSSNIVNSAYFAAHSWCPTPTGNQSQTCTGEFKKYFHEGRDIKITKGSKTYTFQIKQVLTSSQILIGPTTQTPSEFTTQCNLLNTNTVYYPFTVMDLGFKNALNSAIITKNLKVSTQNIPYIDLNYGTVEAYNDSRNYGTFVTSVIIIYNPSAAPITYSVASESSGLAQLVNSSVKIKNSKGEIAYGATSGSIACQDYNIYESIYFIPCSPSSSNLNSGGVSFVVTNTSATPNVTIPYYLNGAVAAATIPAPSSTLTAALCVATSSRSDTATATAGKQFNYPISIDGATSYTVSGDIPSWLTVSTTQSSPRLYSGNPTGVTSRTYFITITGRGAQISAISLALKYIARPVISYPPSGSTFTIYPPDGGPQTLTTRVFSKYSPLLPIIATNIPTSYSIIGSPSLPPGLSVSGAGLVGKIQMPSNTNYPATYNLTFGATNEAGSSLTSTVALVIQGNPITTPAAVYGVPFNYIIIVGSDVVSMSVNAVLPGWLIFDPKLNLSSNGAVANFSGTNYELTSGVTSVIVRQDLVSGGYRQIQYDIPNSSIPNIKYPLDGSTLTIYPPDFNNTFGQSSTFTTNHPLLVVAADNLPTSFSATGLPAGLSIDNYGNIIGKITTTTAGNYPVSIYATNSAGNSSTVTLNILLNSTPETINAYEGTAFCYQFADLNELKTTPNVSFAVEPVYGESLPSWLYVNSSVNSSCHLYYPSGLLAQTTAATYHIVLKITKGKIISSRQFNINYIPAPKITYPVSQQTFYIVSPTYSTTNYTTLAPLLQVLADNSPTSYTADRLPTGLSINNAGQIVGSTSVAEGYYYPTITAKNIAGAKSYVVITIYISASPVSDVVYNNSNYCYKITGLGASDSYTYSGSLPQGLTFNTSSLAGCNISGTSTIDTSAKYPITIYARKNGISIPFSFLIDYRADKVTISSPTASNIYTINPPDYQNRVYTNNSPLLSLTCSGFPTSYSATGLPSPLTIDSATGAVIGGPVASIGSGTYNVNLTANNARTSATVACQIIVKDTTQNIPVIQGGNVCVAITSQDSSTAYTLTSGSLPVGVSFNANVTATCNIYGSPTYVNRSGNYDIVVTDNYVGGSSNTKYTINYTGVPSIIEATTTITAVTSGPTTYKFKPSVYTSSGPYTADKPLIKFNTYNNPTAFVAVGLPSSLSIDCYGNIIGTPSNGDVGQSYQITITASNPAGTSQNFNITLDLTKLPSILNWATPASISYGTLLSSTQLNATQTTPAAGSISYSPAAGTRLNAGISLLTATFTSTDADYADSILSVALNVTKAAATINWTPPTNIYCGATALSAGLLTATEGSTPPYPGTFSYSLYSNSRLAAGSSSISITFTPTDNANIAITTVNRQFDVTAGPVTILWPTPDQITSTTPLSGDQLNAIAVLTTDNNSEVQGEFTYSPAVGTVYPMTGQAVGTIASYPLLVSFTPISDPCWSSSTVTKTVQLQVRKV
jgi:hypothetical protein